MEWFDLGKPDDAERARLLLLAAAVDPGTKAAVRGDFVVVTRRRK